MPPHVGSLVAKRVYEKPESAANRHNSPLTAVSWRTDRMGFVSQLRKSESCHS